MILETNRLLLREFVANDWQAVMTYQSDPQYLRFYPRSEVKEIDARSFVMRFVFWQEEKPRAKYQLAVVLKEGKELIGTCGIRKPAAEDRVAELGYEIAPVHWGQEYATEAAQRMVWFGFEDLGLHRIWSSCVAENVGSVRVMEKVGMRREGELRENQWIKGRWRDTLIYGILEEEWEQGELV